MPPRQEDLSILLFSPKPFIKVFEYTAFRNDLDFFHKMYHDEPHSIRQRKILEVHPEVRKLFGTDPIFF